MKIPRCVQLSALALGLCAARSVVATQWSIPTFEQMVAEAKIIAIVEIQEGGEFACIARVQETLRGEVLREPFRLSGFNDGWAAKSVIAKRALKPRERLLVFLDYDPKKIGDGEPSETGNPLSLHVSTPFTGFYKIREGKIHGGWYEVINDDDPPGVDEAIVLSLLRGYLAHLKGSVPEEARSVIRKSLTEAWVRSIQAENKAGAALADWLLTAQATYGTAALTPVIVAAARSPNERVRLYAARALKTAEASPAVLAALGDLVQDHQCQAEAAWSMLSKGLDRRAAIRHLVRALPTSRTAEDNAAQGIAGKDPILHSYSSGCCTIIRVLTLLGADKEGHDAILAMIKEDYTFGNETIPSQLSPERLSVLAAHFLKFPSRAASKRFCEVFLRTNVDLNVYFWGFFEKDRSPEVEGMILEGLRRGSWDSTNTSRALSALYAFDKKDSPRAPSVVLAVLERFQSHDDFDSLLPFAIPAASPAIEKLVRSLPEASLSESARKFLPLLLEAMRLKASPPPAAGARIERWLELVRRAEELSELEEVIHRELCLATPPAMRADVVKRLQALAAGKPSSWLDKAITALGGTPAPRKSE